MKKNTNLRLVLAVLVVGLVWSVLSPLSVEAKAKIRLSARSKKLSVGQEYTLKMKGIFRRGKRPVYGTDFFRR